MQAQERNSAPGIVDHALAAIRRPFSWAARTPAAVVLLLRRATQSRGEPGQAANIAILSTGKWTRELLKHLEWRRLEELCQAYFEELGFTAAIAHDVGGAAGICLYAAGTERDCVLLQCNAWGPYPVGAKAVRELRSAMTSANAAKGVLLTAGRFTPDAAADAAKQPIELIDGSALLAKLSALPPEKALALLTLATKGDFLTPTCPRCLVKMTGRKSTGQGRMYWGCPHYPRCKLTFPRTTVTPA